MNYKQWFKKKYADKNGNYSIAAQSANYLTREGWLGCRKEVLEILDKYRNSVGVKYAIEEIERL